MKRRFEKEAQDNSEMASYCTYFSGRKNTKINKKKTKAIGTNKVGQVQK